MLLLLISPVSFEINDLNYAAGIDFIPSNQILMTCQVRASIIRELKVCGFLSVDMCPIDIN